MADKPGKDEFYSSVEPQFAKDREALHSLLTEAEQIGGLGVWTYDVNSDVWAFSNNWLAIHGCTTPHLTRKDFFSLVHLDDLSRVEKAFSKAIDQGKDYELEHDIVRRDNGEVRSILAKGVVKRDSSGKIDKIHGVAQDITTQQKNDKLLVELREDAELRQQRLETLLDSMAEATILLNEQGEVEWLNNAAIELHEFSSRKEALDKLVQFQERFETRFLDGKNLSENEWPAVKAFMGERIIGQEIHVINRDTSNEWIASYNATPIFSGDSVSQVVITITDITDRKKAERELLEKEMRLRAHFQELPVPIFIWKNEGDSFVLTDFNKAANDITSGKIEELIGIRAEELYSTPDSRHLLESIHQCYSSKQASQREFEYTLTTTGDKKWIRGTWVYVHPDTVALHTEDLSEKKVAEELLRKNETEYRMLANLSHEAILIHDMGKLIFANNQLYDMAGYSEQELREGNIIEIAFPPEAVEVVRQKIVREDTTPYETTVRRKDGSALPIEIRPDYINFQGKKLRTAVIRDLTEAKKNQQIIRESEERFKSVFSESGLGMALLNPNGQITEVNRAICTILGYTEEEMLTLKLNDIAHPDDRVMFADIWEQTLQGNFDHIELEKRFLHKSGQTLYAIFNISAIKDEDKALRYSLLQVNDISERKSIESQLRQSQKMEAIGTLAGGIAHDFNNILSSVIGFCELSMDLVQPEEEIHENLSEIYSAGKRAKELISQILLFSRQSYDDLGPVMVKPIVEEVIRLFRATIPTNINIRYSLKSQGSIIGNAIQIHQVIMNLCTNGAQAMEESGGTITVTLEEAGADAVRSNFPDLLPCGHIILKISDTGTGIAPDSIASIYEPYFTTKEVGKGTGLGLSMVHGIVKNYGGEIAVKSEVGEGTSFTLYLPLTDSEGEIAEPDDEKLPTGDERVLLIDDEVQIIKMMEKLLSNLGYRVTSSTNAHEALVLFGKSPDNFDIIISDVTMPQMSGNILAEKILNIRPDVPIILCTGYSDRVQIGKNSQTGVKEILKKPLLKPEIAKAIRRVLAL